MKNLKSGTIVRITEIHHLDMHLSVGYGGVLLRELPDLKWRVANPQAREFECLNKGFLREHGFISSFIFSCGPDGDYPKYEILKKKK